MSVDEGFWVCPDCGQENFAQSRFCELCGKLKGSSKKGPGPAMVARFRGSGNKGATPQPDESVEERAAAHAREREEREQVRAQREKAREERVTRSADDRTTQRIETQGRPGRKTKVGFLDFSERVRGMFRRSAESSRVDRKEGPNPVLIVVAAFLIWTVIRLVGYLPLLLLLKFIGFLFTPLGLPVFLACAWLYAVNHRLIHGRIEAVRKRARMFANMAAKAVGSLSLLRGGVASLFKRAEKPEDPNQVRGASVRILDNDWDDEE